MRVKVLLQITAGDGVPREIEESRRSRRASTGRRSRIVACREQGAARRRPTPDRRGANQGLDREAALL